MASIEERIFADLAPVGLAVFEQGTWAGGDLPEEFITYYFSDSTDLAHYDNLPAIAEVQAQVNVYASDPARIDVLRKAVCRALYAKGWTRDGRGYAENVNDATGRSGWFMIFYFAEKEEV